MKDMLGRGSALEPGRALEIVLSSISKATLPAETVTLDESFGRVLASDIECREDIPAFARSTMDGYAVIASDTFGAGETSPVYLDVAGEILMGDEAKEALAPGKVFRIATGGMLPPGADAVLMFEYAPQAGDSMVEVQKSLAPGENVIRRGDDMSAGDPMLTAGSRLRPQDVAALASAGFTDIKVYTRPTVSIISTGDEVVEPSRPIKPGQIRDSNSYNLAGLAKQAGAIPFRRGIFPDDYSAIKDAVELSATQSDIVLISGGSSVGTRDMSERVISDLGEVKFQRVQIKPGKPFLFGTVNGGKPVFGLPGHPRAVAVCFDTFIRPALARLSGQKDTQIDREVKSVSATLTRSVRSTMGRREHIDVSLTKEDGKLLAEPVLGKSGLLRTMVRSDGSICVDIGEPGLEAGETVTVSLY